MEEKEKVRKKIEEIRSRIRPEGFAINRMPEKTRLWFIQFAKDEFLDDRGFALKHLVDFYTGVLDAGTEHLEAGLGDHERRLSALEDKGDVKVEKKNCRTRLDGSPVKEE